MFERYSEKARRVVFWARYETSQYGSKNIEPQHLLLGILRERPDLVPESPQVRKEVEEGFPVGPKFSTSVEVPLSEPSKRILQLAEHEADRLGHKRIGTEHILFALLQDQSPISLMLRSRGIQLPVPHEDRSILERSNNPLLSDVVYVLWHTDAHDDEKLIGVYRTNADALAAIERTRDKPGFADADGRFEVSEYRINEDHWTEGFNRPAG